MVSKKKAFNPTDYEELMDPHNHTERVILNETSAIAFLAAQGYDISGLVKCNDK